ncbi:MAG: hypothetical protein GWO23_24575, partial [Gammaproteobacteria bacterium]|nr:hypothetical protein [Phycisphaerae bacterium]NIQ12629.1 hypothetical protein [Gammaproteobacteria bacterium]NIW50589.1 hypothetical protein [Gammaproteobacteria bacterium]NIX32731.1 hypothetical protein [Phycisphaerae bacterium]
MAYLAIIRSQESIHWSDESNFWVVTGYEDCKALLKNPNLGRGDSWRIASTEDEPLQPVDEFRANVILLRDPPE